MKADRQDKWFSSLTADAMVLDAAVTTLRKRFADIQHQLAAGSQSLSHPETLHQLRVALRRAESAVDVYGDVIPRRRGTEIRKLLRRFRRATNEARDLDTIGDRLAKLEPASAAAIATAVNRRLEDIRPQIADARQELRHNDLFDRRVRSLLKKIRKPGKRRREVAASRLGDWAISRIRPLADSFFLAIPHDWHDAEATHRFRIAGKRLRYAMEVLSSALPSAYRESLYPLLESLQERLGELNDLAVARVRIGEWFDRAPQPIDECESAVLREKLSARHEERLQEFAAWSTDPLQTLAAAFAPSTESTPSQPAEPSSDANALPTADLAE
jgi:CHAD domain-containing protein